MMQMKIIFRFESSFLEQEKLDYKPTTRITNEITLEPEHLGGVHNTFDYYGNEIRYFCGEKRATMLCEGQPIHKPYPLEPKFTVCKEQAFFDAWIKNPSLDYELDGDSMYQKELEKFELKLLNWRKACQEVDISNQQYWFENNMLLSSEEIWQLLSEAIPFVEEILESRTPILNGFTKETANLSISINNAGLRRQMIVKIKR